MPTTEEAPGLVKFNEVTNIMSTAAEKLSKNEYLLARCVDQAQGYLDTIEGAEMNEEIDALLNAWQLNAKRALEIMNTRRAPITQMMAQIAKVFTTMEAKIDPAKPDSIYTKIQVIRNSYAKDKAAKAAARQAELLKQQNADKETIDLKAKAGLQVRAKYQQILADHKLLYTNKLANATLDNLQKVEESLRGIKTLYPRNKFYEISVDLIPVYLDKLELAKIIFDTREALYDELSANYLENMEALKQSLVDQIPSKKRELHEMKTADADRQRQLKEQADQRRREDEQRLKDEQAAAMVKDEQTVETNKQVELTGSLFDSSAQLAEIQSSSGQSRTGYSINVKSAKGWGLIIVFWFERWGKITPLDKFPKKTYDQMKSDCEKHAHATGERIDSPELEYEQTFKAIVTKG